MGISGHSMSVRLAVEITRLFSEKVELSHDVAVNSAANPTGHNSYLGEQGGAPNFIQAFRSRFTAGGAVVGRDPRRRRAFSCLDASVHDVGLIFPYKVL